MTCNECVDLFDLSVNDDMALLYTESNKTRDVLPPFGIVGLESFFLYLGIIRVECYVFLIHVLINIGRPMHTSLLRL